MPRFIRKLLPMGRHNMAKSRRHTPVAVAAVVLPAAAFLAVAADAHPGARAAEPVVQAAAAVGDTTRCCAELVASSDALTLTAAGAPAAQPAVASRWRVYNRPLLLPAGVAPERGLQVRTILTARSISSNFPEIHTIGGVRPDSLRWHPNGLALDVMIPDPSSAAGIALGDEIVAFVMKFADKFAIQDAIWRGTYYTPNGAKGSGYGHYDHVHVTTTGGGYPSGEEVYYR
jgi:hypothetical protein